MGTRSEAEVRRKLLRIPAISLGSRTLESNEMKKTTPVITAILTVLALSGCSEPVTSGVVVEKQFTPAHEEVRNGDCQYWQKIGDVRVCTIYNTYTVQVPNKWTVTIADEATENKTRHPVSGEVYQVLEVGETFDVEGCLNQQGPENC